MGVVYMSDLAEYVSACHVACQHTYDRESPSRGSGTVDKAIDSAHLKKGPITCF